MNTQKQDEPAETKAVAKKYTPEESRSIMKEVAHIATDPEYIFEKIAKDFLPPYMNGIPKKRWKARRRLYKETGKAMMALGLETHLPLVEATDTYYQPYAMEVVRKLIKEYECKTASELALCDVVVNSHVKVLAYTRIFRNCVNAGESINDIRTRFLAMLSKEIDRANRQFITALNILKQLKSPPIEINVKAKTAFVGQNQQFNATQEVKTNDPQ